MRKDHRPFWIKRIASKWNQYYVEHVIRPQFDSLGRAPMITKPNTLKVFGNNITAGDFLHLISSSHNPISFTTWSDRSKQGSITIGDYCLISPGVEITASVEINIGSNVMIGADSVIHDCDWHGLYNRLRPFRCSKPVVLKNNVWVGTRCLIFKGVTVGENSVIGGGSVVTQNIPDNVVAAGNPAKIIKHLNPKRRMLKREYLFKNGDDYWQQQDLIDRYVCDGNNTAKWIKTLCKPSSKD